MAVLLPFRALRPRQPLFFIPGEDAPPAIDPAQLIEDDTPALFIYHQNFEGTRMGVMGVLNRAEANVHPHEGVLPDRVAECSREAIESSSIFLWSRDNESTLIPLLQNDAPPDIAVTDRFGCDHSIWRIEHAVRIAAIQKALEHEPLFIADGHHRYAAGWNLATVQVKTPALHSLAAHRLLFEHIDLPTQPIADLQTYWAETPLGHVRFGVVDRRQGLRGLELPHLKSERNLSVLHRLVIGARHVGSIRGANAAIEAIQTGHAEMAFLVEPLPLEKIEADAERGVLLPPKSTDFFPKLAGGLVMRRHQNVSVMPPTAQRLGMM